MKRLLFETKVSGKYVVIGIILSLLVIGAYFSYAMFTVSKNKNQAISLTAGTFDYTLTVDNVESNQLVVAGNTTKEFTVVLSNPNDRTARFNFYYLNNLPTNVEAGYKTDGGKDTPPEGVGINLDSGGSQTYTISVANNSSSSVTINLGVSVGLDYNDLTLPSNGYLFDEVKATTIAELVASNLGEEGTLNSDETEDFIAGTNPNNYIWYSGKLWRAVSITADKSLVKMITNGDITKIPYSSTSPTGFDGSYAEAWLNDTSSEGFLGTLRDYENFIKTDSVWNTSDLSSIPATMPTTSSVTNPVGLLNVYEYTRTVDEESPLDTYLYLLDNENASLNCNGSYVWSISAGLYIARTSFQFDTLSLRPVVNLLGNLEVVAGSGTETDPYRLLGDYDTDLNGTLLANRYSGEYISFGSGRNELYRIVSIDEDKVKITSEGMLKDDSGSIISSKFGTNTSYSASSDIGSFLNNEFLDPANGYLPNSSIEMIDSGSWDTPAAVGEGGNYMNAISSRKARSPKVGLLRLGELYAGEFLGPTNASGYYWLITELSRDYMRIVAQSIYALDPETSLYQGQRYSTPGIRPALYLKAGVVITKGTGTKEDPFTIALS